MNRSLAARGHIRSLLYYMRAEQKHYRSAGNLRLLTVGGCTRSELAKSGEEPRGGARIVQRVKSDRRGELGRLRTKAHLKHILLTDGHQGVQFGSRVFFPMGARGENDGTGLVDIPLAIIFLSRRDAAAVSAPPMTHHLQVETGRATEVRFERQGFSLIVPAAKQPMNRQRPWTELHSDVGILEAAGREVQAGVKAGTAEPVGIEDASFSGAGGLYPAQCFASSAAIVSSEQQIPEPQGRNG